jgi:hypothetical protein
MRLALAALLFTALLQPAHAAQPAELFDFWVGDWVVTWTQANGSAGKARNRVGKILDGKVIEENFEESSEGGADTPQRLLGRSLSVLDAGGVWRQAWADNQGGFFALTGSAEGESRYFSTEFRQVGEQRQGKRMRFYDIKPEGFTWDWEGSADGGKTWTLLWRLHYRRAGS